jgi:membrane protein involved in colicin uptake
MTNPMIRIHDTSTNTVIDREMTDEEFAQYEADQAAAEARKVAEAEAKAAEEAAKQQAFNDAVASAVAEILAAQQTPATTAEPTVEE